jgi:hypothetical protein
MSTGKAGSKACWLYRLAAAISQIGNVIIFNGSPDETISGRAYRRGVLENSHKWKIYYNIVNKIFFFQDDHCKTSHEEDVNFAKYILKYYKIKEKK